MSSDEDAADTTDSPDTEGNASENRPGDDANMTQTSVDVPVPNLGLAPDRGVVGIRSGIAYGFGLIIYIIGIAVVAGIFGLLASVLGGGAASADNLFVSLIVGLFGFLFGLLGFISFAAGLAGLQYKIIADAVSVGVREAN